MGKNSQTSAKAPLVLAVTSGKGGVGKTNVSVSLACELARQGLRVVLLDADLGLANVDVVLGLSPAKNLFHLFQEGADLAEIIHPTPYGFSILPAASGVTEMLDLDTGQKLELLEALDPLDASTDVLLVDTGAGLGDNAVYFNIAVQERILVLTPEPTSLTDAYALIKVLKAEHGVDRFRVLVNMAEGAAAARDAFKRLYAATDTFLSGVSLDFLGFLPKDPEVRAAVVEQKPFVRRKPDSPAAKALAQVASKVAALKPPATLDGNIKFFWKKLLFQE